MRKVHGVCLLVVVVSVLFWAYSHPVPYLPLGATARFGGGMVYDIALSPDGKYLAVAAQYGAWLLDGATFSELGRDRKSVV